MAHHHYLRDLDQHLAQSCHSIKSVEWTGGGYAGTMRNALNPHNHRTSRLHVPDEETEAQRSDVACQRSASGRAGIQTQFYLGSFAPRLRPGVGVGEAADSRAPNTPQRKQIERDDIAGSINNTGPWALLAGLAARECVCNTNSSNPLSVKLDIRGDKLPSGRPN